MIDWTALRLPWEPRMLSILRIVVGLLFLQHGLGKVLDFPPRGGQAAFHLFTLVPGAAGLLELIGGALIVLGLATRPVAFILSGEMALAYFMSHASKSFFPMLNGGDSSILYCFVFLYFLSRAAGFGASTGCVRRDFPRASRLGTGPERRLSVPVN